MPSSNSRKAGLPPGFPLDPRLAADTRALFFRDDCAVLLHRNAAVLWLILVPRTDCRELYQLPAGQRRALDGVADGIAAYLHQERAVDKINVAAIGNVVPQLHLHVVGRWHDDPCWPDPVWGRLPSGPVYGEAEADAMGDALWTWLDAREPRLSG